MICPYCGGKATLLSSKEFYGRDYGNNIWACYCCDENAYVGTHKNSHTPLGTLANAALRKLRIQAHGVIDPYWKKRLVSRFMIYVWLQEFMSMTPQQAHIGLFNEEQCQKVINGFHTFINLKLQGGKQQWKK